MALCSTLVTAPRVAPSRPTPPGRKRSKGNRALAGARGVLFISVEELSDSTAYDLTSYGLPSGGHNCECGVLLVASNRQELQNLHVEPDHSNHDAESSGPSKLCWCLVLNSALNHVEVQNE